MSKFILILIIISSYQSFSRGYSQNIVKLNLQNVSLKAAFKEIEKRSNYHFLYNDNLVNNTNQLYNLQKANAPVTDVLNELLKNTNLSYQIENDNQVVIALKDKEAVAVSITGKVVDEKNLPLPGVTVKVKGTSVGAMTDALGNFSLNLPSVDAGTTLVVSYLGYETQELVLAGKTKVSFILQETSKSLNEVVVVGYNAVKKSDLTGAVVSVSAEDIRSRPVANALQAIQGKAAGVDITSNERPGEVGSVLIRGARSLGATNAPLYVVDGIPLSAGGIEAINPNDIQSIDILKDASATAIYGSRGANGVILVTTKRGKTGNMSLNYVGTATIETLKDRTQMMNSAQYIEFRRDAYRRVGYLNPAAPATSTYPTVATQADDQRIFGQDPVAYANVLKGWQNGTFNGSLVPTTDWTGMVKKRGFTQDHNLSASGGTDKIKAYGSFGYLYQDGTQLGQNYERYSGNFAVDVTPVKWLTMGGSINVTYGNQNYGFSTTNATGPGSLYAAAQGMLPYAQPFDANGNRINLPGGDINIQNPIGEDGFNINQRKVLRTLGSLYAEITILPGLKYRLNFGPDFYNLKNGRFMTAQSINRGAGEPGSSNYAQLNQTSRNAYTLDHLIYYNKTIDKHDFGITLLQSSSANRQETSTMTATKLPYDSQLWYQLNSVAALDAFGTDLVESSLLSYMARANYSFDHKYLLTASARWDGASQLAPGHKWDFFPSAAVAWRIDQEEFLKDVKWVDNLKIRFGVGNTGNAAVGPYTTEGRLQTLYYTYGASVQPGYVSSDASLASPTSLPNPLLGWEHTTQYNLGFDFSFFKSRLSGVLDVYTSRTSGLLLYKSISSINGYTSSLTNIGVTANKGIDITLNSQNIQGKDFNWSTTVNFSVNKDRIVELANGKINDIVNSWFIGEHLAVNYDYVKVGIWQNTPQDLAEIAKYKANGQTFSPGDIKLQDLNGDYKIDANNDRKVVGHSAPDWTGGITNTFDYKSFSLSVFLYSRWGFTVVSGAESLQGRFAQRVLNYWTPSNPTNDYPAPNYNSAAGDAFKSAMNYQDGSFVKIRDVSLGYYLPALISKKLNVSKIKVYVQALNPGILYSKIKYLDPDLGTSTYNRGIVFGLNVGF